MTDIGLLPGDYVPIEQLHDWSPTSFIDPDLIDPTLDDAAFATQVVDVLLAGPTPMGGEFTVWRPQDERVPRMDYPPENERMWLIAHLLGGHGIHLVTREGAANFGRLSDFRETRANVTNGKYSEAINRAKRRIDKALKRAGRKNQRQNCGTTWQEQFEKAIPTRSDFDLTLPDKEFAEQVTSKFLCSFYAAGWPVHFGRIRGAEPSPPEPPGCGWLNKHEFMVALLLAGGALIVTTGPNAETVLGTLDEIRDRLAHIPAPDSKIFALLIQETSKLGLQGELRWLDIKHQAVLQ